MQKYNAKEVEYSVIRSNDVSVPPLPYFRDSSEKRTLFVFPPIMAAVMFYAIMMGDI